MKVFTFNANGRNRSSFLRLFLLPVLFVVGLWNSTTQAQTSEQNFGTGTGSFSSTGGSSSFIPAPTLGTSYARGGGGGTAPIVLANTNNPLGTSDSYVRGVASSSTSVAKVTPWTGYTATTEFYTSFKVLFGNASGQAGVTSGHWSFYQGTGSTFTGNGDFSTAEVFTGLRFTYANTVVTLQARVGGSWTSSGFTTSEITQGVAHHIEVVGNNSASAINYSYAGLPQTVAPNTYDLYVDGVLFANDMGKAQRNGTINAGTFIGASSTGNAANIFVDDAIVYNAIPVSIGVAAAPPVVTSDIFPGTVGVSESYQVVATENPTSYAVASGALPTGLTLNTTTGEISGVPTEAGVFTAGITATNSAGTSPAATLEWEIEMGNQTITFDPLSNATFGDAPFNLTATATSGLPVSYGSSNPFVATVSGNTVTIVGAGSTTITAIQSGDANWNAATNVQRTLTVDKADQVITFDPLAAALNTDPDFNLTATTTSGLTITYTSSDPLVATVTGNVVDIVGVGTTTISAIQTGNTNYNAAVTVTQDLVVTDASLANQTITFDPLSNVTYGSASFGLTATASSSLPVSYTSDNDDVATVSGSTVTLHGAGVVNITASQAGNGSFNPAPDVTQSLTVDPATLTVSGLLVEDKMYDGTTTATLDFTGASLVGIVGADVVTFSGTAEFNDANAGVVTVTTNLTLAGADAANYVLQQPSISGNILPASQTITFGPLATKTVADAPFDLDATATSGLAVTYNSSDPLVATVSGNTVTIVGVGTATITASQAGNSNYAAATPVDQVLTVLAAPVSVTWNFGTTLPGNPAAAGVPAGITVSDMDRENSVSSDFLLTNSTSSGYPGASGQFNIALSTPQGALNTATSAYIVFTVTPEFGKEVTITAMDFGARSTSSGPQAYSIRSSADDYTSQLAEGTLNNNSSWAYKTNTFSLTFTEPVTFRMYGYNGTSSGTNSNWRIDDIDLKVLVADLPPCTGAPEAGVATLQGDAAFCDMGYAIIELSGNTDLLSAPGLSVQWYSSTDNVNFDPIFGENATTLSVFDITTTSYYYAEISCSGSGLSDVSNTITVTINASPVAEVTGNLSFCAASSTTLTSSVGDSYQWNDDNGILVGQTNMTLNVTTAGFYSVTVTTNGCSATSAPVEVTTIAAPETPVILGVSNVCTYLGSGEEIEFSIENPIDGAVYNWTVPSQATLVSGQGTPTIFITISSNLATAASKQVRATVTTDCGTSGIAVFSMKTQAPSTPQPIEGPADACSYIGQALTATYSIPQVDAASSYMWVVPAGVTIVNDNGNSIDVSFDIAYQTNSIIVYAINGCGVNSPRSITVTRTVPSAPSPISGPTNVCSMMPTPEFPDGENGFYSVAAIEGNEYTWTVPAGATIVDQYSDAEYAYIEVSFSASYTSGNISVTSTNGCGVSAARILKLGKLMPTAPGTIDESEIQTCPTRVISYSISDVPNGALYLEWTVPAGATILSGQGTTSIEVSYPSTAVTGQVTVKGVNGCGTSSIRRLNVKLGACQVGDGPTYITKQAVESELNASIFPNPSTDVFKLRVEASSFEKVGVAVYDITGRAHNKTVVRPGEVITIGENLKTGTYFVELIQGKQRKVVKVVKL